MTGFPAKPPRYVPLGAQRWDWHWKVYAVCASPIAAAELHGILVNAQQRREVDMGLRETVDYLHRTITECVCAVFAFHPDSWNGPWAKVRRLALLFLLVWMIVHFWTNAEGA